ncbi:flagellar motor protein MotB [Sporolactobacillus sp. THM7-4]|nr:flagellar motor protein MotB [Sporolactobacillus sp. THM7-4]
MSNRRNRRRFKTVSTHDNSDRWLVTYSDLITLLLVFFVLMYSMSSIENQRFNALVSSLKSSFQGNSILQGMGYVHTDQGQAKPTIPAIKKSLPSSQKNKENDERKLDTLYLKLDRYIKENKLSPNVSLAETPRGIQLTFREKILFDLGKADIKPNAEPVLKQIGGILNEVPNDVSVEGYTDNTPFRGSHSRIRSNWELSGVRAQKVMNYLIHKDKLPPSRFHFTGYGQYKPIVKNDTPAHKAMNRRVNIVIMREQSPNKQE